MQYRKLGRTGVRVSAMCLGTATYGNQVGEPSQMIEKVVVTM